MSKCHGPKQCTGGVSTGGAFLLTCICSYMCDAWNTILMLFVIQEAKCCLQYCTETYQVEGTFLRLAQGVYGVQHEHVIIEVNNLE